MKRIVYSGLVVSGIMLMALSVSLHAESSSPSINDSRVFLQDNQLSAEGVISNSLGEPLAGIFVQARHEAANITMTVISQADGSYQIPDLLPGTYIIQARQVGYETAVQANIEITEESAQIDLTLEPTTNIDSQIPSNALMDLLPDGEELREFIIECTGCHQISYVYNRNNGWPSANHWRNSAHRMLSNFGPNTGFPIIGPVDVDELVAWLTPYVTDEAPAPTFTPPRIITDEAAQAIITEYDFPGVSPHDVALLADKTVAVTGMFDHDMWRLDPATGEYTNYNLPFNANPRAIELDEDGNWWIVFGQPHQVAMLNPETDEVTTYDVGLYAHSIAIDAQGRVWVNGHFTTDPIEVKMIEPSTGEITQYDVATDNSSYSEGLPISYDLRAAPNGLIWVSDLHWNRIYSVNPDTAEVNYYEFPETFSAPRRFDFDAEGNLWIPEYAGNRLAKFDPITETFTEYDLPTSNVQPYVAKVDKVRNVVWIGYGGGDMIARFDIATETFIEYRLPTQHALTRHLVIDEATGDIWFSYHHAPTVADKVVRLQLVQ